MDSLGGLFSALGELFGGAAEFAGENVAEAVAGGFIEAARERNETESDAVYERYLAGVPRPLNVNDR
jgi:hypothetical protein